MSCADPGSGIKPSCQAPLAHAPRSVPGPGVLDVLRGLSRHRVTEEPGQDVEGHVEAGSDTGRSDDRASVHVASVPVDGGLASEQRARIIFLILGEQVA